MPIPTNGVWYSRPDEDGKERWRMDIVLYPLTSRLPLLFPTWTVLETDQGTVCQNWLKGEKMLDIIITDRSVYEHVVALEKNMLEDHQVVPKLIWQTAQGAY